jgi:glycine cleavage system aminomethyltransferase T
MGYVTKEVATIDTEVNIIIRDKPLKAKIVKIPFE